MTTADRVLLDVWNVLMVLLWPVGVGVIWLLWYEDREARKRKRAREAAGQPKKTSASA